MESFCVCIIQLDYYILYFQDYEKALLLQSHPEAYEYINI